MKLSKEESESQALIDYLDDNALEVSTSIVTQIEVPRNLLRANLDPEGALRGFYLVALDDDVRHIAVDISCQTLRSLDAIHIASALAIGDRDLHFVTYDDRQAQSAREAGLKVIQPGRSC